MPPEQLEAFIDDVFHNVLDLRECNRRLMEDLSVRQREQGPVIQEIGDVFLAAASEFRLAYPAYVGHLPLSEKRLKEETDANANLRMFFEVRGLAHAWIPHDSSSNATCFFIFIFSVALCTPARVAPAQSQDVPHPPVGAPAEVSGPA
jgi:hypothetical protein